MRHDWIFDVLTDLRSYAQQNALPLLAAKVDDLLRVAKAEVASLPTDGETGESPGGTPRKSPANDRPN